MADPARQVFLSYRREISWPLARAVRQELRAHGFDVFLDTEDIGSGRFEQVILREIEVRAHFLLLLEPQSLERITDEGDWLRREISHALIHRRNVVPLLANGARPPSRSDLPDDIALLPSFNAVEVQHDYFEAAMEKLRNRFLRAPESAAAPPPPDARVGVPPLPSWISPEAPRARRDPRTAPTDALSRAMAGAVDLAAIKARFEAADRARAEKSNAGSPAAGRSPWIVDATEETFQAEVLERSINVPVVVDLCADWSGPCKQLSPILTRLAEAGHGTWVLARVDVDANPRIVQAFGVQSIPRVVAVVRGQPQELFTGAQPEAQVRGAVDALIGQLRDHMPGIVEAECAAMGLGSS